MPYEPGRKLNGISPSGGKKFPSMWFPQFRLPRIAFPEIRWPRITIPDIRIFMDTLKSVGIVIVIANLFAMMWYGMIILDRAVTCKVTERYNIEKEISDRITPISANVEALAYTVKEMQANAVLVEHIHIYKQMKNVRWDVRGRRTPNAKPAY